MNITLILGSVRQNRESIKPALFMKSKLLEAGFEVNYLDLLELNLPVFNDSPEQMQSEPVQRLLSGILQADGTVIVFPEYNHNIGAGFVNALAFLRKREFLHRPIGLVGVSDGQIGGARAILLARGGSLATLGGIVLPTAVQVPNVDKTFPDEHTCTSEKVIGQMDKLIREMSHYAPALHKVRSELNPQ